MSDYRTIDTLIVEYLREHPDEIEDYLMELFEDYAQDRDSTTLISSLHMLSTIRKTSSPLPQSPFPEKDRPYYFKEVVDILHTMGYYLIPKKEEKRDTVSL